MKKDKPFYIILTILLTADLILLLSGEVPVAAFSIIGLALIQNVSFSMVSRSRNRDNTNYHAIASLLSNTLWYMTMRKLVLLDMTLLLFIPYATGTLAGSVFGVKISMIIEKILNATSDSHLKEK